jgi:hypothetical protein
MKFLHMKLKTKPQVRIGKGKAIPLHTWTGPSQRQTSMP